MSDDLHIRNIEWISENLPPPPPKQTAASMEALEKVSGVELVECTSRIWHYDFEMGMFQVRDVWTARKIEGVAA